jgi:hypothetical protein
MGQGELWLRFKHSPQVQCGVRAMGQDPKLDGVPVLDRFVLGEADVLSEKVNCHAFVHPMAKLKYLGRRQKLAESWMSGDPTSRFGEGMCAFVGGHCHF